MSLIRKHRTHIWWSNNRAHGFTCRDCTAEQGGYSDAWNAHIAADTHTVNAMSTNTPTDSDAGLRLFRDEEAGITKRERD